MQHEAEFVHAHSASMSGYFPDRPYPSIAEFFDDYARELAAAARGVDRTRLAAAQALLEAALARDAQIFCCGNGGSAAISDHLVCDHAKGLRADTDLRPRVVSLSANGPIVTAIANDIGYAEVFSHQLSGHARPGDVLIAISSSGDSENIVRALEWAAANGIASIAMTGFDGGRAAALADVNLHVPANNYGVVEDTHQSLMHILAQFARQSRLPKELFSLRKF